MQRFLNQHIYDLENYDCQQEGIETVDINYTDNHLVIETFLNVIINSQKNKLNNLLFIDIKIFILETLWYISYT